MKKERGRRNRKIEGRSIMEKNGEEGRKWGKIVEIRMVLINKYEGSFF